MRIYFIIFYFLQLGACLLAQGHGEMVQIAEGQYLPLYGPDSSFVAVDSFYLDKLPVTNADYLAFLKENPKWQRSEVVALFADGHYMIGWKDDLDFGTLLPESPVNYISWFAAKNYCASMGKRLPTVDEWEYVAMADERIKDARKDSLYNLKILNWYEAPKTWERIVGESKPNYWGVYDMHHIVWEWNLDFNSILISGESRKDGDVDRNLFCAGGAIGVTDLMNYAAFMRYAFRGSLKANYCIKNLGFRCAKSN